MWLKEPIKQHVNPWPTHQCTSEPQDAQVRFIFLSRFQGKSSALIDAGAGEILPTHFELRAEEVLIKNSSPKTLERFVEHVLTPAG